MTGRIPQSFIDDIVARTDIVEVVGQRVHLKKSGREYKACCPFHDEKTPSFYVSPQKQFYHCFGCGAHGTPVGFLMDYEHLEFPEAIEKLAAMHGMDVPREGGEAPAKKDENLYALMEDAARFYQERLKDHEPAVDYLKERGVSGEIARDFRLGYAPDAWEAVKSALGTDARKLEALKTCGMLIDKGAGKVYDRFRDRIMFPIRDARGRVIAFGGRVLEGDGPKYMNSPETPLFHKGRELYGLYEARQALREIPRLLVVEGYMDVVALAQNGIRYAVATLGTATTSDHLERLFRITDEVAFCFDGDRAGQQAAWRALEESLPAVREGREVRFLFLPEGEDPDSLVRSEGPEAFEVRLLDAQPLSEFLEENLSGQVDMGSLDGRAKFLELARPLLARIPAGIYRDMLVEQFARRARTDATSLRRSLSGTGGPADGGRPPPRGRLRAPESGIRTNLVRRAVQYLVHEPGLAVMVEDVEGLKAVQRPGIGLLAELVELGQTRPDLTTAGLLEHFRGREDHEHLLKLARSQLLISEDALKQEFASIPTRLIREGGLKERLAALQERARQGGMSEDEKTEYRELLRRKAELDRRPGGS